jgi:hypothetical protein
MNIHPYAVVVVERGDRRARPGINIRPYPILN